MPSTPLVVGFWLLSILPDHAAVDRNLLTLGALRQCDYLTIYAAVGQKPCAGLPALDHTENLGHARTPRTMIAKALHS